MKEENKNIEVNVNELNSMDLIKLIFEEVKRNGQELNRINDELKEHRIILNKHTEKLNEHDEKFENIEKN